MTDHPNLASALVAALADLCVVDKGRTANVGTYRYDYAALEDVVKVTRPVLASHGIVALTPLGNLNGEPAVTVTLLHVSGEREVSDPFPFPHGKDAQATGSAVTYHRRYALLAALGMAAGDDDDDGAAASPRDEPRSNGRSGATDDLTRLAEWLTAHPDRKQEFKTRFGSVVPSKVNDLPGALVWINGGDASTGSTSPEGEPGATSATGGSSAPAPEYDTSEF